MALWHMQALEKNDKALLVNVDKMAYANLYVTDGDLHVQAVDTLPTPNPRGVFDSQRTNMVGNARAVPCVHLLSAVFYPQPGCCCCCCCCNAAAMLRRR